LLVQPKNEEALATGLERLLHDEDLRTEISLRARRYARDNFSIDRIREQYCEVYEQVLNCRVRSPIATATRSPDLRPRLQLAIVAPSLRYVGGQSVQADSLIERWKEDPEVEARFVAVDPRFPFGLRWAERLPFLRTAIREPLYALALWKGLKSAEVAHIFSASYSSFLLAPLPAWFIARLRKKKTLINYHSGECRDHLQRSAIARKVLKATDRVVVPSGYLVNVLGDFGIAAVAVPNIADVSQLVFRERRPLRPHLICTRGFHPYYCVDIVVRAFAEVRQAFPAARLDLVGSGPVEREIRQLVRDLRLEGVEFKGVAARHEIGHYYNEADIFINASRLDNMPVSLLEAFAAGLPVVTTQPEGMNYIVEHERTGLLSAVGDAHALAQNVVRLLKDAQVAERLVLNARDEMQKYSWQNVREQWLAVYRSLGSEASDRGSLVSLRS
jgi:L-malate glycosyltransferase